MKRVSKVIFSILIAMVISGIITFFFFFKGFSLIETGVYFPNLKAVAEKDVMTYHDVISKFLTTDMDYFRQQTKSEALRLSYGDRPLSAADISLRQKIVNEMFSAYPKILSLRLVDPTGVRIHFSTDKNDIKLS